MIGSVIGGGYLVERIGSRNSLRVDCLGYIIGSLLVSLTNSLPLILFGRIITGNCELCKLLKIARNSAQFENSCAQFRVILRSRIAIRNPT